MNLKILSYFNNYICLPEKEKKKYYTYDEMFQNHFKSDYCCVQLLFP